MSFPWQIHLGPLTINSHLFFETVGMFIGFRYFLYLRKRQSDRIADGNRVLIIIGASLGALVGSRLVGALEQPVTWIHSAHPLLYLYANKTVVGGLLGGLASVECIKKIIGEKQSSGDLFTYPLILAMIIGRIGCFSSGLTEETYGLPTKTFLGIDFGDGMSRHPVTLYEMAFLAILWLVLWAAERRRPFKSGYRFQFFLIAYLAFRFGLDFIKPRFTWALGLTTIQLACLVGLLYYARTVRKIFTTFSDLTCQPQMVDEPLYGK